MVVNKSDMKLAAWVAALAVVFGLLTFCGKAHSAIPLTEPVAFSLGSDDCSMFVDGCQFPGGMSGVANRDQLAEDSYYKTIKDGVAAGIDAFGFDAKANTTTHTWMLGRFAAAMKRYNGENPSAKRCIFVSYRNAGGEANAMYSAANSAGSADSPYCTLEGKPIIGVRQTTACVNPLSGNSSSIVLGTMSGAIDGVPTRACVDTWKKVGASRVIAYTDGSATMNPAATAKATAASNGAEFAAGVSSSWAEQCGGPECRGPDAPNYTFRDGRGYLAAISSLQAALKDPSQSVVFADAFPGQWDKDASWESARVCETNDVVPHNVSVAGINPGFTCPTVPDRMRGTIPMGGAAESYSNKAFTKAGFNRLGQWFRSKFRVIEDPAARPFLLWAYREHPFALSGSGMSICPSATASADGRSFGGLTGAGADSIFLASYAPVETRVRVSVGSTVLGTFTLPARQLDLETDARQTAVPIGAARGRPRFEVLDASSNVIASRDGDVTYTDTPLQRANTSGRNYSVYADTMPLPLGTQGVRASVNKVNADRAEGNSGTSESLFRVTLDRPAPSAVSLNWDTTSSTANKDDFFYSEEVTTPPPPSGTTGAFVLPGTQCVNVTPPPAAAAAGFTKLDFCDSFETDSVARGSDTASRTMVQGKHLWNTESAVFGKGFVHPAGDITFPGGGILRMRLTANQYQKAIQSVQNRNGVAKGYWINDKRLGYYIEFRVRQTQFASSSPQIALWTMDMCHWLGKPVSCAGEFLEMDLLEYPGGKRTWHAWKVPGTRITCDSRKPQALALNVWQTAGSLHLPNGVTRFFKDGTQFDEFNASVCPNASGYSSGDVAMHRNVIKETTAGGRHPLLIGGKPGDHIEVDFFRVWVHPNETVKADDPKW